MFTLHEKVVYPGQGVAEVRKIVERFVNGAKVPYYELIFMNKRITVLVPIEKAELVGLRILCNDKQIKAIFNALCIPARKLSIEEFLAVTWNRRSKKYQAKILTGRLEELLEIYRDLYFIGQHKELSFGEKHVFEQVETLLIEEFSLIYGIPEKSAQDILRIRASKIFKQGQKIKVL